MAARVLAVKKWAMEMGIFFEGTGARSSDKEMLAIAPKHPAFEVVPVSSQRASPSEGFLLHRDRVDLDEELRPGQAWQPSADTTSQCLGRQGM